MTAVEIVAGVQLCAGLLRRRQPRIETPVVTALDLAQPGSVDVHRRGCCETPGGVDRHREVRVRQHDQPGPRGRLEFGRRQERGVVTGGRGRHQLSEPVDRNGNVNTPC